MINMQIQKPGTFIANAKIMSQQSAMKKEGREKIQ